MTPASRLIAVGSLAVLSACSTAGTSASDEKSQTSPPVQWKEVDRIVNGSIVRYRVPVTAQVNDNMSQRSFGAVEPAAKSAPADRGGTTPSTPRSTEPAPPPAPSGANDPYLPWARPPGASASEGKPVEIAQGTPATGAEQAPSSGLSQEAETALGQAEIAVREAQSRFQTAQAALERARDAAQKGDSASTIKFAKTAVSLSRSDR